MFTPWNLALVVEGAGATVAIDLVPVFGKQL